MASTLSKTAIFINYLLACFTDEFSLNVEIINYLFHICFSILVLVGWLNRSQTSQRTATNFNVCFGRISAVENLMLTECTRCFLM